MKKILLFSFAILFIIIGTPTLKADAPVDDAKLRWADDKLIYTGRVNANSWVVETGIEDAAIDVDYFTGNTLRAIVACPDTTVRMFRSDDNGQTWSKIDSLYLRFDNGTQPRIVHGTDSTYHFFIRALEGQGRIYTAAYRTSDDSYIIGTGGYLSGPDSVKSYSVCTNRRSVHDYSVYLVYHVGLGGRGQDEIKFTKTTDMGQNWQTPITLQSNGSGFPDITCGEDQTLHLTYLQKPTGNNLNRIRVYTSLTGGFTWLTPITIFEDSFQMMSPQIAAAYNGSGNVWTIWSFKNLNNPYNDWGLLYSISEDSAANWSPPTWCNSVPDSSEVLPSIGIKDEYGSTSNRPYVTFLRGYYDWSGTLSIHTCEWMGSDWSEDNIFADSNAVLTKPIQTFILDGEPAIAYVGRNAENVYFDSRIDPSGISEENDPPSNEKIKCSIDQIIITGAATLKYTLPVESTVDIYIANILGQKTATLFNDKQEKGEHTLSLSAKNLSQGIYFIVIETEYDQKGIAKATVLK